MSVYSGTLNLANGGTNSSTITVATNATLQISSFGGGSILNFTSDSALTNWGNLVLSGGTVNLAGSGFVAGTNIFSGATVNVTGTYPITTPVVMSAGTLTNSVPLVINGPLNWSGGTIQGIVQCQGGTLSGAYIYLQGGELINTGTLILTNAFLNDGTGSVISNEIGATVNITANANDQVTLNGYGGAATFYNAGLLNVSVGKNIAAIDDTFINTGSVTVNSGTLNLQNGGTNSTTITVATNATLEISSLLAAHLLLSPVALTLLNGGNFVLNGGTVNLAGMVLVAGTNIFSGATINVTGTYPITTPVVMSAGTLTNSVPLVINGPLNWSGGTILSVVQCNGGTLSGEPLLDGGQLINTGTLAWDNARPRGWGGFGGQQRARRDDQSHGQRQQSSHGWSLRGSRHILQCGPT